MELSAVTAEGQRLLAQINRDTMGRRTNLLFDCFAAIAAKQSVQAGLVKDAAAYE